LGELTTSTPANQGFLGNPGVLDKGIWAAALSEFAE
jgi:hypothetical protein